MGQQARLVERSASTEAAASAACVADDGNVVDELVVDAILEQEIIAQGGDPVRGIRNALIAGVALWAALALVWFAIV